MAEKDTAMALPRVYHNLWHSLNSILPPNLPSQPSSDLRSWQGEKQGAAVLYQVSTLAIQDMHRDGFIWALAEDIDGLLKQSCVASIKSYKAQVWED